MEQFNKIILSRRTAVPKPLTMPPFLSVEDDADTDANDNGDNADANSSSERVLSLSKSKISQRRDITSPQSIMAK